LRNIEIVLEKEDDDYEINFMLICECYVGADIESIKFKIN